MKSIEIIIAPSGEFKIDAVGFKGPDCEQATAFLEAALGSVNEKERKPEFRQRALRQRQQKVGR